MKNLAAVRRALARAALEVPGNAPLQRAAERAAESTNSALRQAHVPARARVVSRGRGVRVELVQTDRITRPFTGRTPLQLLRSNVEKEMRQAAQEIRADARKVLSP